MEKEVGKDIPGYEGKYQASTLGNIRIVNYRGTGNYKIMKQHLTSKGYLRLSLDGKNGRVHRVIAMTFIDNPKNLSEVNHKNEIKTDNRAENLEWCNHSYNINYGNRNNLLADKLSREVIQYSLNDTYIACYPSTQEASRQLGKKCNSGISRCCRGIDKTAGGFKGKYKDEVDR